jgi:hypothetical protein
MIPELNRWIQGKPENILNILLFAVAGISILVALLGSPALKAVVAAWLLFP